MSARLNHHVGTVSGYAGRSSIQRETVGISTSTLGGENNVLATACTCQFTRSWVKCIGVSNIVVRTYLNFGQVAVFENSVTCVRLENKIGCLMVKCKSKTILGIRP